MSEVQTKQLGDLKPGEWFDRDVPGDWKAWVVTDDLERYEGRTLCVHPETGAARQLANDERVYPRVRPYFWEGR